MFYFQNDKITLNFEDALYIAMAITRCNCIPQLFIDNPQHDKKWVLTYALATPWEHECKNPWPLEEDADLDD